jgi:cytochrome d ubiquinol oxidase subunit I
VAIVYFAFRIMVGVGLLMLALVITGLLLWRRDRLFDSNWYLRMCTWCAPIGFVAVLAGWTTTEVGRQPWVVYGLMRTADAVTPSLTANDVWLSLAGYVLSYLVIFGGGLVLLGRLVRIGPRVEEEKEPVVRGAHSPLSAATDVGDKGGLVPGGRDAS